MSSPPGAPRKKRSQSKNPDITKSPIEDNNNKSDKSSARQQARTFITWYRHMVDNERQNLALYLSDDATLDWFGKTIKTRKKVSSFLKHDMQCSRHYFTTVESIDEIKSRRERIQSKDDSLLASSLNSPEIVGLKTGKKRLLRPRCNSPEWAEGCGPEEEFSPNKKRPKACHTESVNVEQEQHKRNTGDDSIQISNKGDGVAMRGKRKCVPVTPPNVEVGQGDCLPSTSGTESDKSHDTLNAQLPRLAVECNGFIEFTRTRNSRSVDTMKWERKFKIQISYSEDPLNVGEYILWTVRYTDESKCRRNLLPAFEEIAREEGMKKVH